MNKQISDMIDEQTQWFEKNMLKITRKVRNRLNSALNKFDRTGGYLSNTPQNIDRLNNMYSSILNELQNAGFTSLIRELSEKENELLSALRKARPTYSVPLAFTETSQSALNAFNNMWNTRIGDLGMRVSREIHSIIGEGIFAGRKIDSLIASVESVLEKDFVKYATTYVNTSRGKFIQLVQYESSKNYEGELFWIYQGPEDDVTRPVCREGTGMDPNPITEHAPFYTEAERVEFESYSLPEREYNCRHTFIQITEEYYKENVR